MDGLTLRVTCVELSDQLATDTMSWETFVSAVGAQESDILITNELPFGPWLARGHIFDRDAAEQSIRAHDIGLTALANLNVPLVLTSRPIWEGDRLANQAVAISNGDILALHRKQHFPSEPGWYEKTWFGTIERTYQSARFGEISIGVLLCTELMFNEHARHYGSQDVSLIAVPRATGQSMEMWHTAASMAAIVSGAYVISSNRIGGQHSEFGGGGFAFAPDGKLLGETTREQPCLTIELDLDMVAKQRKSYPCYVARSELPRLQNTSADS